MMIKIEFSINAIPHGKARARFYKNNAYTPKSSVDYEKMIKQDAWVAMCKSQLKTTSQPVVVEIEAIYPIAKSWSKKKTMEAKFDAIKPSKPDLDNVIKSILDGCNAVVYLDDQQVHTLIATKRFQTFDEEPCVNVSISWTHKLNAIN